MSTNKINNRKPNNKGIDMDPLVMCEWKLGFKDRGLGHIDFGIITKKEELIVGNMDGSIAEHIVEIHNKYLKEQSTYQTTKHL